MGGRTDRTGASGGHPGKYEPGANPCPGHDSDRCPDVDPDTASDYA